MENVTYADTNTSDIDELNRQEVMKHLPILLFYLLILIIGIVGNSLVLIVYKCKLKRSSARVYIISLAMADLFVCVFGIPYHVLDKIWILNYTSYNVCKILTFIVVSGTFSSVFILLVVGLDRFLKICKPLKRQIRDFGDRKACLIAVVLAILLAAPHLELYGVSTYIRRTGLKELNCFIDDDYGGSIFAMVYLAIYLLIFIGSVLYLIVMYGFICRKIYEHDKMQGNIVLNEKKSFCGCTSGEADDNDDELNENSDENKDDSAVEMTNLKRGEDNNHVIGDGESTNSKLIKGETIRKKENEPKKKPLRGVPSCTMVIHGKKQEKNTRKITLMMCTITIVFIIAYLPHIIISVMDTISDDYWDDMSEFEELLNDILLRFYLMNNVVNPIIYCFWDKRFRKECMRMLRRVLCCKDDDGGTRNNSSSGSHSKETQYSMAK